MDVALTSKREQKWVDEAIANGSETPLPKNQNRGVQANH